MKDHRKRICKNCLSRTTSSR